MLRREERDDVEHEHSLAERVSLQLEDQTCTITVCPNPGCIRPGPAPSQEPFAVGAFAEHDALLRLHRMVDVSKGQRAQMQTQRSS